jgi:hypothetical protein
MKSVSFKKQHYMCMNHTHIYTCVSVYTCTFSLPLNNVCSLPHTIVVIDWGGCEMRMASRLHGRDEKFVQDFD